MVILLVLLNIFVGRVANDGKCRLGVPCRIPSQNQASSIQSLQSHSTSLVSRMKQSYARMRPTNPQLCQTVSHSTRNEGVWWPDDSPHSLLILTKFPRACSAVAGRCEISIHKPMDGFAEDHTFTATGTTPN